MSDKDLKAPKYKKFEKILFLVSAIFLPNIFLFNLYNVNREISQIIFGHILILGLILAGISVIGLLLSRLIIRNYEGSIVVLLVFWPFFWFFEAISARFPINSKALLLAGFLGFIFCLMIGFRFISSKLYKGRLAFNALAGVICMLFAFNAFPAILANVGGNSGLNNKQIFM